MYINISKLEKEGLIVHIEKQKDAVVGIGLDASNPMDYDELKKILEPLKIDPLLMTEVVDSIYQAQIFSALKRAQE